MKEYYVNGQSFYKLTSRKEAAKKVDEIKLNCKYDDNCFYYDSSLYVKYTDGTEITFMSGDDVSVLKKSGIAQFVLSDGYGETFYNAFPQFDESYTDEPYIRVGIENDEYGKPADLDMIVKQEIKNGMESSVEVYGI